MTSRGSAGGPRGATLVLAGPALLAACGASPRRPASDRRRRAHDPDAQPDAGRLRRAASTTRGSRWSPGTRWTYSRYTPTGSDTAHGHGARPSTAGSPASPPPPCGGRCASAPAVRDAHRAAGTPRTPPATSGGSASTCSRTSPASTCLATRPGRPGATAPRRASSSPPRRGSATATSTRFQPGVVESRSTVPRSTPPSPCRRGPSRHRVATRDLSPLEPSHSVQSFYARGIGLVAQQTTEATSHQLVAGAGAPRPTGSC